MNARATNTNKGKSGLRPPAEDLERRRRVWEAMSEFFLDTQLEAADYQRIAGILKASGYSVAELDRILWRELCPVLWMNLLTVAGVWEGFDMESVEQKSLSARPGEFAAGGAA